MNDKTLSANELIHALKHGGRTPDIDLIRTCLERVDELELALLDLLRIDPWEEYDPGDDTNPLAYGDVHAGHLLIAARSQAALPVFYEIFRDSERERLIEWFGLKMSHYGSVALPFFTDLMLDEEAFGYGRSVSASILTHIAYNEPEYVPIVISSLQKLLPPLPEGDATIIGDDEFDEMWMWAALELSNLGDMESQPQIKALYAANAIETWVIGDYDDYMTRLQNDPPDSPDSYDIIQTYESLHHRAVLEAQREAKWAVEKKEQEAKRAKIQQRAAERAAAKINTRSKRPRQTHEQSARGEPSVRKTPKVNRNAPCPCGSGKKYKKCHGRPGR